MKAPKPGQETMKEVILRAHFDGQQIRLDDPFELTPDTPLTVVVATRDEDPERGDWALLSARGLEAAYAETAPEYPLGLIKERNPDCEGPEGAKACSPGSERSGDPG